jgi:hypothetical protein
MDSATFSAINSDVVAAIGRFSGPLSAAVDAAGDPGLSNAISDLGTALRTTDESAAITLEGMASAVAKAASHYSQTDANVARAASPLPIH